jgi:hypothetical protein
MKWQTATFSESANPAPAVGLIQLGQKRMDAIRLDDLRSAIVILGASEACHIRVDHMHVSARHLAFIRQGTSWTIASCPTAKNTTLVSGIPLKHGLELELPAGVVIRVGYAAWVTIGADFQPGIWRIAAQSRDELYTAALFVYGSARKAATILGVNPRTYTRALHRIPEAAAFLHRNTAREHQGHCSPFGVVILPGARYSE